MARTTRPHVAARVEDAFHRRLAELLRRRGWTPRVTASTGYADHDGVHVFARVLLAPAEDRPSRVRRRPRPPRPPRGWRAFLTAPAAGTAVTVQVDATAHTLTAGRGGYVHVELPVALPPGWHDVIVSVAGRAPVTARTRAADPDAPHGVICDIDDTILITWVPRPLLAVRNTFVLREHARRPVPGMAQLLRALAADGPMVYLSTGAWNFAPHLERFIAEHGHPPGPLLLTDWGPTERGWFRSGSTHKREMLERLRREHPRTRWTLVGDDGQRDPHIYAAFAAAHPEAVRAIAIRTLSIAQQVLTTGLPLPADPPRPEASPVVQVTGSDGHELRRALEDAGVLPNA